MHQAAPSRDQEPSYGAKTSSDQRPEQWCCHHKMDLTSRVSFRRFTAPSLARFWARILVSALTIGYCMLSFSPQRSNLGILFSDSQFATNLPSFSWRSLRGQSAGNCSCQSNPRLGKNAGSATTCADPPRRGRNILGGSRARIPHNLLIRRIGVLLKRGGL